MVGNKVQEGKVNRGRTMNLIVNHPGISRIEASEILGLNRSTLTHIVNDLLSSSFILEEKIQRSGEKGGRIPIGLHAAEKHILGVEWQDRFLRYSLCGLTGESVKQGQVELQDISYGYFEDRIADLIDSIVQETGEAVYGVSLALPGRIDPHKGIVLESKPLGLKDFGLAESLSSSLGVPVLIENDANCFAWGEIAERGDFKGNLLCLLLEFHSSERGHDRDQEVGLGLVASGEVYHGSSYSAGELRMSPVEDSLRVEFLRLLDSSDENPDDLAGEYCRQLFSTLQPVIATLDPELLILGGDFFIHKPVLEPFLRNEIETDWKFSEKGIWEVASGAASFFVRTIFSFTDNNETALHKAEWENILKTGSKGDIHA